MIKVMKQDDIDCTTIVECSERSFAWIHCHAVDKRTDALEEIEMWIEADEDTYKAECSRMLSGLGFDLINIDDHYEVNTTVNCFEQYRNGVSEERMK